MKFFKQTNIGLRISLFRILFSFAVISYLLTHLGYITDPYLKNHNLISNFQLLGIGQWSQEWNYILFVCLLFSFVGIAVGYKARYFIFQTLILYFLYMGNYLGVGKSPNSTYVWHSHNLVFYLLLVMLFLPSISRLKIHEINKLKGKNISYFKWEELLILITVCAPYFGSGYVKLLTSGAQWADGFTMQAYFIQKYILTGNEFAKFFITQFDLLIFFSWTALIFESFLIFGLLIPYARWFSLLLAFVFHLFIYLALEVNFLHSHYLPWAVYFIGIFYDQFYKRDTLPAIE